MESETSTWYYWMRVSVLQSNYLPWKGYFDLIGRSDVVVFYDDVQFTKQDWRHRNRIQTANGLQWLTIPVGSSIRRRICDVQIADSRWQRKHWKSLLQAYCRYPHFGRYHDFFESFYLGQELDSLSEVNQVLIRQIAREWLNCTVRFADSRDYRLSGSKSARLLDLLSQVGATRYVTGPAALDYIEVSEFTKCGVELEILDYQYPEYWQPRAEFHHNVSIVDLLFATGPDARGYIW